MADAFNFGIILKLIKQASQWYQKLNFDFWTQYVPFDVTRHIFDMVANNKVFYTISSNPRSNPKVH